MHPLSVTQTDEADRGTAKHIFENRLHRCIIVTGKDMSRPAPVAKATAPAVKSKKKLKELFDERNRSRPGSKEEEKAAEKILEALFPDTDAG
jgi:hypothetical protein